MEASPYPTFPSYSISVSTTGVVVRDMVAMVNTCFSSSVYGRNDSFIRGDFDWGTYVRPSSGRKLPLTAADAARSVDVLRKPRRFWFMFSPVLRLKCSGYAAERKPPRDPMVLTRLRGFTVRKMSFSAELEGFDSNES